MCLHAKAKAIYTCVPLRLVWSQNQIHIEFKCNRRPIRTEMASQVAVRMVLERLVVRFQVRLSRPVAGAVAHRQKL